MVRKISKKGVVAKKDKEWREAVMTRDRCCRICKKADGRLNAHHLIPKQFKEFRWDVENGIILCFQHHKVGKYSAHQNAIWFTEWLFNHRRWQYDYAIMKIYECERSNGSS